MNVVQLNAASASKKRTTRFLLIGSIGLIVCFLGMTVFWLVSHSSAEQDIRELLERRASALAKKDLPLYLSCFSPKYRSGTRTYADLQSDASQWFAQFVTIQFVFQILDLEVTSQKAIVENSYKFSLTTNQGEPLEINQRELLEIQRENKEWKITRALSLQ